MPKAAPEGQVRLWLNVGSRNGIDEAGIRAALEAVGAPSSELAHVEVLGPFSYLFVPSATAEKFEAASGKEHNGRKLKVERAKQ